MEDVLEEIVGDVFDKSLRREIYIKRVNDKTIRADARATIEQIRKRIGIGLKEKHFTTIAGFIELPLASTHLSNQDPVGWRIGSRSGAVGHSLPDGALG